MNSRWLMVVGAAVVGSTWGMLRAAAPPPPPSPAAAGGHRAAGERHVARSSPSSSKQAASPAAKKPYRVDVVEGRVVWLAEAVARRWGVHLVPEAAERLLAVETADGRLEPILEDARGRAFRVDPRLRAMDLRLVVRRYTGLPLIQILQVEEVRDGHRYTIDYWCDVCSIQMFEKGPCSCCQAPNRLRKRRVDETGPAREQAP